jgi:hypothetical protein
MSEADRIRALEACGWTFRLGPTNRVFIAERQNARSDVIKLYAKSREQMLALTEARNRAPNSTTIPTKGESR